MGVHNKKALTSSTTIAPQKTLVWAFGLVVLLFGFLAFYAQFSMQSNKNAVEIMFGGVNLLKSVEDAHVNLIKAGKLPAQFELALQGLEKIELEMYSLQEEFDEIGQKFVQRDFSEQEQEYVRKFGERGQQFYRALMALLPIKKRMMSHCVEQEGSMTPLYEVVHERELQHQKFTTRVAGKIRKGESVSQEIGAIGHDHYAWYSQRRFDDPEINMMFEEIEPLHKNLHDVVAQADLFIRQGQVNEAKKIMDSAFAGVKLLEKSLESLSNYSYAKYHAARRDFLEQKEKVNFLYEQALLGISDLKKYEEETILTLARENMYDTFRQSRFVVFFVVVFGACLILLVGLFVIRRTAYAFGLSHAVNSDLQNSLQKQRQLNADLEKEINKRKLVEDELHKTNAELAEMAITDGLTGLYNHRYMNQYLHMEHNRAIRYGNELSVIMIDVDFFKKVNDTYGHGCGDVVLLGIAELLVHRVRSTDMIARFNGDHAVVARYGGEEMAIILPETPLEGAVGLAEDLREMIEGYTFNCEELKIKVTVSIGVASSTKSKEETWSSLLGRADAALYKAKSEGRNKVMKLV